MSNYDPPSAIDDADPFGPGCDDESCAECGACSDGAEHECPMGTRDTIESPAPLSPATGDAPSATQAHHVDSVGGFPIEGTDAATPVKCRINNCDGSGRVLFDGYVLTCMCELEVI